MTIKKPMKEGGATIADRFRLDTPAAAPKGGSGKPATVTFAFALVAFGVAGLLTYLLWQHWEFLLPV